MFIGTLKMKPALKEVGSLEWNYLKSRCLPIAWNKHFQNFQLLYLKKNKNVMMFLKFSDVGGREF